MLWTMKPTSETIDEFKRLYAQEFGEELSDAEAYERFLSPLNVLRIIFFPRANRPVDNQERYDIVRTQNQ